MSAQGSPPWPSRWVPVYAVVLAIGLVLGFAGGLYAGGNDGALKGEIALQIMRGAVAAQRLGLFEPYVEAVYRAMWVDGLKMDDPQVIETALTTAGLPAAELMALTQDPEVKAQLIANTEAAVAHGVFGSPSFLVGGELFFGKDRLRDVEEEIAAQA